MAGLEAEASDPQTPPSRLQELANNYPRLRPLIAMNPATYPALVEWLGTLGDPSVNVALSQRSAANQQISSGPKRVSVMGRDYPPSSAAAPASSTFGAHAAASSGSTTSGGSTAQPVPATVPQQNEGASATTTASGTSTGQPRSSTPILLLVGLIALIVIALLGYKLLTTPKGATETSPPEGNEVVQEEQDATGEDTESDTDEPTEEVVPEDPKFPAPGSAISLTLFVSPSGNIACALEEDSVSCTINSYDFTGEGMQTCGAGPLTITADAEKAGVNCSAPAVQATGATTLSYGDYASNGNVACESTEVGVSCWNIMTGSGFGLARAGYLIGVNEPVDPELFPWN